MMHVNGADWPQILLLNAKDSTVSRRRDVEIDNNLLIARKLES